MGPASAQLCHLNFVLDNTSGGYAFRNKVSEQPTDVEPDDDFEHPHSLGMLYRLCARS